ncbi:hypothetical protein LCGC14_3012200 [marine sediment metagenome]|uniref:ribonucleoside-diphosphate reductase n=1 Tax=marine sediment metagenome TaxID=412755 RepID=A0A0F8Z5H7_9ZZZZ
MTKKTNGQDHTSKIVPCKRAKVYDSSSEEFVTGCGSLFVHVSMDPDGNPVELFSSMGKAGGCSPAMLEAVGKATSIGLRCGIDPQAFVKQYIGIRCPSPQWDDGEQHYYPSGGESVRAG